MVDRERPLIQARPTSSRVIRSELSGSSNWSSRSYTGGCRQCSILPSRRSGRGTGRSRPHQAALGTPKAL